MSHKKAPIIDLREIQETFGLVLSAIGLLLNFLLLYLILRRTGPKLKSYRKILLQNCVVDLIYNIANGITRTQSDFKDGNFFLIMTSAYGPISSPYSNLLIAFWGFALFCCVTSLPVQFIYRYYLVVKDQLINGKNYAFLVFISFLSAFIYALMSLCFLWPSEKVYAEKAKLLEADIYYYKDHLIFVTGDIRHWYTSIQAVYASFLINISYIIVTWTSYKVWKHLNVMRSHMSTQTRDIHRQMTKALIMQAIIPFLICLLPIGINIIMVLLRASIDGFGIAVSLILSWIPIINSTMTILIVKSYRRIIIAFCKQLICSKSERNVSSIPNVTPHQTNTTNNKISQA